MDICPGLPARREASMYRKSENRIVYIMAQSQSRGRPTCFAPAKDKQR